MFGGAPFILMLIWKVVGAAVPNLADSKPVAVAISIRIGLEIYEFSEQPGASRKQRIPGCIYALINSFVIAASVPGIDSTLTGRGVNAL